MSEINEAAWKLRFWRAMREALYEEIVEQAKGIEGLTASQVEAIRFRYAHGERRVDLAQEYNVSRTAVFGCTRTMERVASFNPVARIAA